MRSFFESQAFINTLQLHSESRCRRLFKARHHEVDTMKIASNVTSSMSINIMMNSFLGLQYFQESPTVYSFDIQSDRCRLKHNEMGTWRLTKRYSEFAEFRVVLLSLIRRWEAKVYEDELKLHSREFELISNSLRKPIMPNFPRKHLRKDNQRIIVERRFGLRHFVRKLLDVYADLSVDLYSSRHSQIKDGKHDLLREIYDQLERFLCVPSIHKELERRHTAAILALEDVEEEINVDHEVRICCICLEEAENDEGDEGSTNNLVSLNKLVQLPCLHRFHEDCVIEWFNTSTSCPLCRKDAVVAHTTTVS